MSNLNKTRCSNIELLRICLMSMIVLWHIIIHGIINSNFQLSLLEKMKLGGGLSLICYHVNTFILISGYYGIKLSKHNFLSYCFQIFFYVFIAYILYLYTDNEKDGLLEFDIRQLFPIHFHGLWFAKNYLFLMLLAPFINCGSFMVSKKTFLTIIITLLTYHQITIDYNSTSELHFFLMYLIGRYISIYPIGFIEKNSYTLFVCGLILILIGTIICILLLNKELHFVYGRLLSYTNPIVIAISIFCFVSAKNFFLYQTPIINFLAKGSFAVYLFTDGFLRNLFVSTCFDLTGTCLTLLLSIAIIVTIALSLTDYARRYLFSLIYHSLKRGIKLNSIK